jgi:hypothetical protein
MENKKPKTIDEPPKEVIKSMQKKCWDEMGIKLPKKDVIAALEKTKEAEEADKLLKRAIDSWPHLSEKEIADFRKIYGKKFGVKKQLSVHEINEAARKISIIAMVQKHDKAGAAIRAIMVKHKEVVITDEDRAKIKKLFQLAFDIELTNNQIEYYLKLSYWFVWYKKGLSCSLAETLNNLLTHYDKKKRGKKGSLQTEDYDIGYFYRWLGYVIKEPGDNKESEQKDFKEFTLEKFINWMDTEFHSVRSSLAGDKCEQKEDGTFTMSMSLCDWD